MTAFEIIDFSDSYAADFARLNYDWIEEHFAVEQHDHEILDDPKKWVIDVGGQIFMVIVDGQVAGTVAMIPAAEGVFELTKMAVSREFQGKGLGDRLMLRCLEFARDKQANSVFLESHTKLAPALSLYRKHGFVETPPDPDSLYARADIRMELALSTASM